MTDAAKRILEARRKLSREERALIAAELRRQDGVEPSDTWCGEVERRISDFEDDDAFEDAEAVYRKLVADLEA